MSAVGTPMEGAWVLSRASDRLRGDVPRRCGACGYLGTERDFWNFWVGIVSTATLCAECAEALAEEEER